MEIMKHQKMRLLLIFLFGMGFTSVSSQESVHAAGGDAYSGAGAVNYSVGQIVYTTDFAADASVAKGVQQPLEISVITAVEETSANLDITAFPNPTREQFKVKVGASLLENLIFQVRDNQGRLIKEVDPQSTETEISLAGLESATYFLNVMDGDTPVRTFKILKH